MSSGKTNRIIFFGTEDFSATSLQALIAHNFDVVAVVTKPDTKKGRGQTLKPPTVKVIAQEHDIPVWQPTKITDITDSILQLQPVAGVLVSFGKIIPQSIIDLFTPGIINVHPSRLPKYRGPSPIESAILHGDTETAVSIMQLSSRMDAGPVYRSTPHPLTGTETQSGLYETLAKVGANELVSTLPHILSGEATATPQNESDATYCSLIQKEDGRIDWKKPAAQIEREIRAYQSWPSSRTNIADIDVIITEAHVSTQAEHSGLEFKCGDDQYIVVDRIKPVGKKEMPVQAFLAGYKHKL